MSNESIDLRDYGRLEAQVEQLTKDVHSLKETVEGMSTMMQQAQGGWRAIMLMSGAAGIIGGGLTWLLTHMKLS